MSVDLEIHPRFVTWKDPLWGRFHKTGIAVYGGAWDAKRPALCGFVTRARTASSTELYPAEMLAIIDLMQAEQNENFDELPTGQAPEFLTPNRGGTTNERH